ncbi:MAG: hypothetical protein HQM14_07885 [SAR324 cluster bacterium]|nr:hypothetical protein [SAR324 cluster bacterium]
MALLFSIFLFIITVIVIIYPLYFQKITKHISEETISSSFNEQDSLLSAITELEEEFQLGRLSDADYQHLKLHFQKRYLHAKQIAESENP